MIELVPGALFSVPQVPHDGRVLGDEPYVSLHFLGAEHNARQPSAVHVKGAILPVGSLPGH